MIAIWTAAAGVLAMLVFAEAGATRDLQPDEVPHTYRLVTYNIRHGTGNDACTAEAQAGRAARDCAYDLSRTARVIASFGADVLGLQEVDRFWARSGEDDQPALLGAALEMATCYGANLVHEADVHSAVPHEYGTLILSRHRIVECRNTLLPHPAGEQRGVLEAVLEVDGTRVHVYNTHLDTRRESRAAQTPAVAELVSTRGEPVVIMGDFNAEPEAAEMAVMFDRFVDAWRSAGDGPGFTSPAGLSGNPRRRIDYIFTSPDTVRVHSATVAITDATRVTADHYPVQATVSFGSPR